MTLVAHNWPIMIYSALIVWMGIRAYLKPTRPTLLVLYGLIALAAAFEYQKHGALVAENTVVYLLAADAQPGLRYIIRMVFLDGLRVFLYLLGFSLLAAAGLSSRQH